MHTVLKSSLDAVLSFNGTVQFSKRHYGYRRYVFIAGVYLQHVLNPSVTVLEMHPFI